MPHSPALGQNVIFLMVHELEAEFLFYRSKDEFLTIVLGGKCAFLVSFRIRYVFKNVEYCSLRFR